MNHRPPRNWRRRRLAWITGLLTLACAPTFAAGTLRSARRRAVAREQQDQATRAVWEARTVGARRWAPGALGRAEQAARDALVTMQVQEARLPLLADFSAAASVWSSVRDVARDATQQAMASERDARNQSDQAIIRAHSTISQTLSTSEFVHLGSSDQMLLSRATLALSESRNLHRLGEYSGAQVRAEWATEVADHVHDDALNIAGRYLQKGVIATWHRWKLQLVARSRSERQPAILIEKADRRITLYLSGKAIQFYNVDLVSRPDGS